MNYDIFKSRTFYTLVFGFLYSVWQLFEPSIPPQYSAVVDLLVVSLANYFHVAGVKNAAVSSAAVSQPVSGQ